MVMLVPMLAGALPAAAQDAAPASAQTPAQIPAQTSVDSPAPAAQSGGIETISQDSRSLAQRLLTPTRQPRCDEEAAGGGITVCGHKEDPSKVRLPLRDELESAHATSDGVPRAPNVFGIKPGAVSISGCFLPPCPREALPYIDFSKMPADPPGSDADRIGRGEIRAP